MTDPHRAQAITRLRRRVERLEQRSRRRSALVAILAAVVVLGGAAVGYQALTTDHLRLESSATPAGADMQFDTDGMPRFTMHDREGLRRVDLGLDAAGKPELVFYGDNGNARASIRLAAADAPVFAVHDRLGKPVRTFDLLSDIDMPLRERPRIQVTTSLGAFTLELRPDRAPATVKNFLRYVDEKAYDGTILHRVVANYLIQGGAYTKAGERLKTGSPVTLEVQRGLSNLRGTIAMARQRSVPQSATSQFFINVTDRPELDSADGGYAVFGSVIDGLDVIDRIRRVKTTGADGQPADRPEEAVIIEKMQRLEPEKP